MEGWDLDAPDDCLMDGSADLLLNGFGHSEGSDSEGFCSELRDKAEKCPAWKCLLTSGYAGCFQVHGAFSDGVGVPLLLLSDYDGSLHSFAYEGEETDMVVHCGVEIKCPDDLVCFAKKCEMQTGSLLSVQRIMVVRDDPAAGWLGSLDVLESLESKSVS